MEKGKFSDIRLRTFCEVARTGSFSLAARNLSLSQPLVSGHISSLEKDLGVRLFDRSRREVGITPEGAVFLRYAERILYWCSVGEDLFSPYGVLDEMRRVQVHADGPCSDYILPEVFSVLFCSHPSLRLIVGASREDADVALFLEPRPDRTDLQRAAALVGTVPAVGIRSSLSGVSSGRVVSSLSDMEGSPLAIWSGYEPLLDIDIRSRVSFLSPGIEAVLSTVRRCPGLVGVVPACSLWGRGSLEGMEVIPLSLPSLDFDLGVEFSPSFVDNEISSHIRSILEELSGSRR